MAGNPNLNNINNEIDRSGDWESIFAQLDEIEGNKDPIQVNNNEKSFIEQFNNQENKKYIQQQMVDNPEKEISYGCCFR